MIRINLLPVRVSKKKAAGKQQLALMLLVMLAGFAGNFVWAKSRADDLAAREAKVKKTRDEIAQLDRIIGEVKNIKEQQAALREKLDILGQLKANRAGPVRVLDAIATLTPKRLSLEKLEEKSSTLTFTGSAATIDDVSTFMTALKGDAHFSRIELKKTSAAAVQNKKLEYVDFVVTAGVAYAPKPPGAAGDAAKTPPPPGAAPKAR